MVDTKYKDHKYNVSKYRERPSTVEWIGVVTVIAGASLSLLTVAQRMVMGYYAVGLALVAVGSVLMFYRLPAEGAII